MSHFVNPFSLLGDEEGDDFTVLVDRIATKAEVPSSHATLGKVKASDVVQTERDQSRGRQGHGINSGGLGVEVQGDCGGDGNRKNFNRGSYGSGDAVEDGSRRRGRGGGRGPTRGFGRGMNDGNGQQNVSEAYKGDENQLENDDAGWQYVSRSKGKEYVSRGRTSGNGKRRYINGNQNNGGEKRGFGYQGQQEDAGLEQPNGKGDVNKDNKLGDEERAYGSGNRYYGGERRRGYGGYRGRGRREYRRNDNGEVKETSSAVDLLDANSDHVNAVSGGDAGVVSEAPKAVETEEKKISEEVNGDVAHPKREEEPTRQDKEEGKKKEREEYRRKKREEEEKDAALMTLDQYEKLLSEKRQAMESLKTEERRVSIDKELEAMRLVEKKQNDSDVKLKSEEKLKKKDSLEKKEKGSKAVAIDINGFFKPAFRRRNDGGRGQGQGGRGCDNRGYPSRGSRMNDDSPQTNGSTASARLPARILTPTETDFPALGAKPALDAASVKA